MTYDFERIRDEVEREFSITAVNEAIKNDPDSISSFTNRDRGIKAMQVIDQAWDEQTNQIDINASIQKTNKTANKESKKESAAKELIKSFLSEGYYGYMLLRKAIGHKLEHPVLRPWYANELFRIPSLVNPGGKVYLTEGTFSLSAQITALSNLVLEGSGWQHTKLLMAASVNAIGLGAYDSITIRDLEIDGNSRSYTPTEVISGNGNDDVTIERIFMHDHQSEYGIELWNSNRLKILDSRFTKIGKSGGDSDPVSIQSSTDIRIDGNHVYDSVYEYRAGGIEVQDISDRCIIVNNFLNKLQNGIVGSCHSALELDELYIIANNICTDIYNVDLEVGPSTVYPCAIRWQGISGTNAKNVIISGNLCEVNTNVHAAPFNAGIDLHICDGAIISNNIIDNAAVNQEKGNYGIELSSTADAKHIIMSNNICRSCYYSGIKISAPAAGVAVNGNYATFNDRGIHVTDGDYIFISNNRVQGNTTAGITIAAGKNTNGWTINNPGYNPVGNFTAPSVPASTTAYTNQYGYPCMVSVYGGTVTAIAIDAVATGLTSGAFMVAPSETITLTYSVAPTWVWYGL